MVDALSLPNAVLEVNHAMAQYAGQVATHPYGSKWYTWPIGWRGIYVWNNDKLTDGVGRIYLFPNVVTWWLAAFGIVYLLVNLLPRVLAAATGRQHQPFDRVELVLAMAYLANLLPFVPIDRVMFLYHYFPALIVSVVIAARLAGGISKPRPVAIGIVLAAGLLFAWQSPIVYGFTIDQHGFDTRMLLPSWI
jgi:dolichyl-phosphate-mannose-protein mannosyltransferase